MAWVGVMGWMFWDVVVFGGEGSIVIVCNVCMCVCDMVDGKLL